MRCIEKLKFSNRRLNCCHLVSTTCTIREFFKTFELFHLFPGMSTIRHFNLILSCHLITNFRLLIFILTYDFLIKFFWRRKFKIDVVVVVNFDNKKVYWETADSPHADLVRACSHYMLFRTMKGNLAIFLQDNWISCRMLSDVAR